VSYLRTSNTEVNSENPKPVVTAEVALANAMRFYWACIGIVIVGRALQLLFGRGSVGGGVLAVGIGGVSLLLIRHQIHLIKLLPVVVGVPFTLGFMHSLLAKPTTPIVFAGYAIALMINGFAFGFTRLWIRQAFETKRASSAPD